MNKIFKENHKVTLLCYNIRELVNKSGRVEGWREGGTE